MRRELAQLLEWHLQRRRHSVEHFQCNVAIPPFQSANVGVMSVSTLGELLQCPPARPSQFANAGANSLLNSALWHLPSTTAISRMSPETMSLILKSEF